MKNKTVGIVGKKLNHSLSPLIHNLWIKKSKLNAKYIKFEINEKEINKFYQDFERDKCLLGLNITVPYKEIFYKLCPNLTKRAKSVGSTNLLYKKNNKIYGDNTDYIGFTKIYQKIINKEPRKILLIGAGGAARPIIKFFNNKKINNIDIYAKSLKKQKDITNGFSIGNFYAETRSIKDTDYDLIINASPAGTLDKNQHTNAIFEKIKKAKYVIDIVYSPLKTKFLAVAHDHNVKNIGGLNMLIEQAKPSFDTWFNTDIKINNYLYKKIKKKLDDE